MKNILAMLIVVSAVFAAVSTADAQSQPQSQEATDCAAKGGTLQVFGRMIEPRCIIPYKDAGKVCTDKSECEGQCWATDTKPGPDGMLQGKCQPTNMFYGCNRHLVKGQAMPVLCVD